MVSHRGNHSQALVLIMKVKVKIVNGVVNIKSLSLLCMMTVPDAL